MIEEVKQEQKSQENSNIKEEQNSSKEIKKETLTDKVKKKIDPKSKRIEELEKELENTKNDYLRTLAEFENFRKRNIEELTRTRDNTIVNFVQDLLPAIDNFEMSLKMTDNKEMFVKGVEMIHQNLIQILKENNIEEFLAEENEEFNPTKHDPVLIEDKTKTPGFVISTIRKGFTHKSQNIIRPAKVQIVKEVEEKNN